MSEPSNVSRRGLLQILGVAGAGTAFADQQQLTQPVPTPEGKPHKPPFQWRVFDPHQQKTVTVLSDLIIPADDRSPAASAVGVPEFIDDWIAFRTEQDGYDRLKAEILGGLVWLDRESNRLHGQDFAAASEAQQKEIIDRIAWPQRASEEDSQWASFFGQFRDLVVSGFFSSKAGVADLPYLGNTIVTDWIGCDPKVWAVIEQRMQNGYKGLINPGPQQPPPEPPES